MALSRWLATWLTWTIPACVAFAGSSARITYVTGTGIQQGAGAALDSQGNSYLLAQTDAPFIDLPGLPRTWCVRSTDIFLAKFQAGTNAPLWARCFGGSFDDRPSAIAVGPDGSIYIAGSTNSSDFPGPNGPVGAAGALDGFIIKLSPDGAAVLWTALIGGASDDRVNSLFLSASGDVYAGGETQSPDLPVVNPVDSRLHGVQDGFIARLNASTGAVIFCTYIGGTGTDRVLGVSGDAAGNVYAAGATDSLDFPLAAPLIAAKPGPKCGFVSKLRADGGQLLYSTYLCGSYGVTDGSEQVNAIVVDSTGNAYVGGVTSSQDFPLSSPYQSAFQGWNTDSFLAGIAPDGSRLLFGTFLGGGQSDTVTTLKLDEAREMLTAAGSTMSLNFPGSAGVTGPFVVQFSAQGQYAKTLAPMEADLVPAGLAVGSGKILVTGTRQAGFNAPPAAFVAAIADPRATLIWINDATRQATIWQLQGGRGSLQRTWAWISVAGVPGWKIVATADFDRDGTPDLIWQDDSARRVTAWYQSGPQANTLAGWQWVNRAGVPGWSIVAAADFNGDGIPDLVWLNDTTRQVTVWYMGGAQGNAMIGWNWISLNGVPGWKVVAAADFNGDGTPDLVWQNDVTRQATVWYMGGAQGNAMIGWNWIETAGIPGWRIAAATDVDGDGTPDLIWQNDVTRQTTVWYMGGVNGNVRVDWEWINSSYLTGWTITAGK